MNKRDLIKQIAEDLTVSQTKAAEILQAIIDNIENAIIEGEDVRLLGFGSFQIVQRSARVARNPQTGSTQKIPSRKAVKFSPSKGTDYTGPKRK